MLKFGIKISLASGACYYLAQEGVWKHSSESTKLYTKISDTLSPIIKENSPVEIPSLPSSDRISFLTKHYWNQGVLTTFQFIEHLPANVSCLSKQGMKMVAENPEVQKFLNSFNAAPEQPINPVPDEIKQ